MKRWLLLILAGLGLTVVAGMLAGGRISPIAPWGAQRRFCCALPAPHDTRAAPRHLTASRVLPARATHETPPRPVARPAQRFARPAGTITTAHRAHAPARMPVRGTASLAAPPPQTAPAAQRYVLVDPPVVAPGATVRLQGGGFAPGASVHLVLDAPGQKPLREADVAAGPDGAFQATGVLPLTQTAPSAAVAAQDGHGQGVTATLLLRAAQPLAGLAPKVVTPGQRAAVWVANARPGETMRVYAGRLAGSPLLTARVGSDGRGSWPLAIPYGPGGPNQLVLLGDQGQVPIVAPYLLLNLYPHAAVSSYAPQPGTKIAFYGGGFGPDEQVELRLDRPTGPIVAAAGADNNGGLRRLGPFAVPFGLAGAHTFLLRGAASHAMVAVGVTIEPFFANARPSTYAAGPGTLITFYGDGFAPGELVRVYVGRTARSAGAEVAALRTTAAGKLVAGSGFYTLPADVKGPEVAFTLVGDISGAAARTSLHYLPPGGLSPPVVQPAPYHPPTRRHTRVLLALGPGGPLLLATPPRIVAGGTVSLWGSGFPPHANVQLVLTSRANPQGWALRTVRSAADGTLSASATVPTWVTHADAVRAAFDGVECAAEHPCGSAGSAAHMAWAELDVEPALPHLIPSTYSGVPGTPYRLAGDGFTAGEQVALYLDSVATPPLAETISGGGHITFDGLAVPVASAGAHIFIVRGAGGEVVSVPMTMQGFTPFILLSTYSSLPERPVSISGQGFAPGETVHLFTGEAGGTPVGAADADSGGALHATSAFTIPTTARGALRVVAVGAVSGLPVKATLDVQPFRPSLWLSAYAGHPGSTVAFTGTGYARDDVLSVYRGDTSAPVASFRAHNGAFDGAGALRIPFGTPGGMVSLTVRGAASQTTMTLRYLVIPFTPGAGFEVRRRHGVTVLRLGSGGFAPGEMVRIYRSTRAAGKPWRLMRADASGNLPLIPVLTVKGLPTAHLAYSLAGAESGATTTALYLPPRHAERRAASATVQRSGGGLTIHRP
jgi:hypothetical protein